MSTLAPALVRSFPKTPNHHVGPATTRRLRRGAYNIFVQTTREIGGNYRLYVGTTKSFWIPVFDYRTLQLDAKPHKDLFVLENPDGGAGPRDETGNRCHQSVRQ